MSASRALAFLSLLLAAPAAAETGTVRRLALLVGVNDGGPERVRLRYAVSDARSFDKVLGELGGVASADRRLLVETGRAGLLEALGELRSRAEAARAAGASRVEVLVYYSGHSDEAGLLLKGERLGYDELRRTLNALPADVHIAVLDSCASGAFARARGGPRPPAVLVDTGNKVMGHAILTSSSEDETSQESDRLGASYFTHHLISGLRGAADVTRDGRVTLNEAYQFAFRETLARTEKTRGGAQHPAHDIELAGSGDLVMTDLRATSAGLSLGEALEGHLFVRDEAGTLVVELRKLAGRPAELGLAPGRYHVRRELDSGASEARFTLVEGQHTPLDPASFRAVPLAASGAPKKGQLHVELFGSDIQLTNLAVKFGGGYVYMTLLGGIGPDDRLQRFSLGLGLGLHLPLWGERMWLNGDVVGHSVHRVRDPFEGGANLLAQGRLMLGVRLFERFALFGGPTYNVYFAWSGQDRYTLSTLPVREEWLDESTLVRYWPGVQLGVRL